MNKRKNWTNGLAGGLILLIGGFIAMMMAAKGARPSDHAALAFAGTMSIIGALTMIVAWITRRPRATEIENL